MLVYIKKYSTPTIEVLRYNVDFIRIYNTLEDYHSLTCVDLKSDNHKL